MKFAVEHFNAHAMPPAWMLGDHYRELAAHKETFGRPNPDVMFYARAQTAGELIFVVARCKDEMVGYMALLLRLHPHYRHIMVAIDDLHYLMPAYRGQGTGSAMIEFAEKAAARKGASIICTRDKFDQDYRAMWEAKGYKPTDIVYTKVLRHVDPE